MNESLSNIRSSVLCSAAVLSVLFCASSRLDARPEASAADEKPKVILLGFDGVDAELTRRFMEEGLLPRLEELSGGGTYSPLQTTNPAQSPVAWASIVTGLNPGKTNIAGFIRRQCDPGGISPVLATVEYEYGDEEHTQPFSEYSWLNRGTRWLILGACALAVFLIGFFLKSSAVSALHRRTSKDGNALSRFVHGVTGFRKLWSFIAGAVLAGLVLVFGSAFTEDIPESVPFPYNLHQGDFFWDVLGENGIRCTGLYAPGAYPCLAADGSKILGGLGVPDVSGSTGTWYVYTDDDWVLQDRDTDTGGMVVKLEERGGMIRGPLFGPTNFVEEQNFREQIEALRKKRDQGRDDDVHDDLRAKEREYSGWKRDDRRKKSTVEFTLDADRSAGKVVATVQGQSQLIAVGEWSGWFRVNFKLSTFVEVPAIVRMRLVRCDEEQIRIFVPAIDISPEETPGFLKISSPDAYATHLCDDVGLFETVGWSCITHGLKDEEIDEYVFLEDIEYTMSLREKVLKSQLELGDFDALMAVFYTPDRLQHMMYRLFDPAHPLYDAVMAEQTAVFFGEEIKLKDTVPAIYRQVDRIVGEVLDRVRAGEFGGNCTLIVVSDHGFAPYYYGVNLNNFLAEKGYLKLTRNGEAVALDDLGDFREPDIFKLADWKNTRAYSLGLGKIFVNLKGREADGIVTAEDYGAVVDAIVGDLEAYSDPATGKRVVKKAFRREEIFSGSFWKEGEAEFSFNRGSVKEKRKTDGFADIYLGFNRGYRVSWQTTLGGLEEATIVSNELKWSGDHVSVMPDDVAGIFFSNAAMETAGRKVSVVDVVPTIYSLFGIPVPGALDGTAVPVKSP